MAELNSSPLVKIAPSRRDRSAQVFAFLLLSVLALAEETKTPARASVDELIAQLTAGGVLARAQSADRLGALGRDAAAAVPALVKASADEAWFVRAAAATALGRIGADPGQTVPALIGALKAARAIADEEHSHRPGTSETLLAWAGSEDTEVAWRAMIALGRYVAAAEEGGPGPGRGGRDW